MVQDNNTTIRQVSYEAFSEFAPQLIDYDVQITYDPFYGGGFKEPIHALVVHGQYHWEAKAMLGERSFETFGESPSKACDNLIVQIVNFYDPYLELANRCLRLGVEIPTAIALFLDEAHRYFKLREFGLTYQDAAKQWQHITTYGISKDWERNKDSFAVLD